MVSAIQLGIAIGLSQVVVGRPVHHSVSHGSIPVDDPEVRRNEMREVFDKIRGEDGQGMRRRIKEVRGRVVSSWKDGLAKAGMEKLVNLSLGK